MLANLFMHYAFDAWLAREFPVVEFERYADDAVVHCATERRARQVLAALVDRMEEVGLRLHPDKTKIVYCKDGKRRGEHANTSFTFLGFTFRPRSARRKDGGRFLSFCPAISKEALKKISCEVRRWRLHKRINHTFAELAKIINPMVAGWMQYYGRFYRSQLYPLLGRINVCLVRWIRKKCKRLKGSKKAHRKLQEITTRYPRMFTHWRWVPSAWQEPYEPRGSRTDLWEPGDESSPGYPTGEQRSDHVTPQMRADARILARHKDFHLLRHRILLQ